jgi:hypothetical protein
MMIAGFSARCRTVWNTAFGDSVVIATCGCAAVGQVCHRGAPPFGLVGSGVSGNTPMWPHSWKLVISIEPMPYAHFDSPS